MARAGLDWTLDRLAEAAGVSRKTIQRLEKGEGVALSSVDTLRRALEEGGASSVSSSGSWTVAVDKQVSLVPNAKALSRFAIQPGAAQSR
jgi:transcriptional regulator with XRE-family HTH domain